LCIEKRESIANIPGSVAWLFGSNDIRREEIIGPSFGVSVLYPVVENDYIDDDYSVMTDGSVMLCGRPSSQ